MSGDLWVPYGVVQGHPSQGLLGLLLRSCLWLHLRWVVEPIERSGLW